MRTIMYSVWNKKENKRVYINCRGYKCEEYIANLENKEDYEIRYKWMSI